MMLPILVTFPNDSMRTLPNPVVTSLSTELLNIVPPSDLSVMLSAVMSCSIDTPAAALRVTIPLGPPTDIGPVTLSLLALSLPSKLSVLLSPTLVTLRVVVPAKLLKRLMEPPVELALISCGFGENELVHRCLLKSMSFAVKRPVLIAPLTFPIFHRTNCRIGCYLCRFRYRQHRGASKSYDKHISPGLYVINFYPRTASDGDVTLRNSDIKQDLRFHRRL